MNIKQIALFLLLLFFSSYELWAQCTQCKQAAAARDEDGNLIVGTGLNFGILYLLLLPFFFIAITGGIWYWKNRQTKLKLQQEL